MKADSRTREALRIAKQNAPPYKHTAGRTKSNTDSFPFLSSGLLIKNLIKLPSTSTAAVGELFNFVMGSVFSFSAGYIYARNKSRKGALIGAVVGAALMAVLSVPFNYFLVYPAYVVCYGLPLDAIIGMYQAIRPSADGLLER